MTGTKARSCFVEILKDFMIVSSNAALGYSPEGYAFTPTRDEILELCNTCIA
jgi:hypothetical protein